MMFVEVALDGVKDTVDKLRSFVGREPSRYLECFVDGDSAWSSFVKKFVDCETKDVAIDDCHSRNAPVFSAQPNALVQLAGIRERARCQSRRKFTSRLFNFGVTQLSPVRLYQIVW